MTQIEQELTLLKTLLECAEKLATNTGINQLEYHPVGFADMIANLDNPCHISDVIDCVNQFVKAEIKYIVEDK